MKWFIKINPDIICLQEIRAEKKQLPIDLINLPYNFHASENCKVLAKQGSYNFALAKLQGSCEARFLLFLF